MAFAAVDIAMLLHMRVERHVAGGFGELVARHVVARLVQAETLVVLERILSNGVGEVAGHPRGGLGDLVVELPLDPMHGTIGVAPAGGEVFASITPGAHGGNMDTPEMRAGTTCYLGVNVEGALFSIGDGHCRQGEGESCGVAVEAAMDTVVAVDLVRGRPPPGRGWRPTPT